jgi:hypothetical protein
MLMVNTPPQERPPPPLPPTSIGPPQTYDYGPSEHNAFFDTNDFGANDLQTPEAMRRPSLLPAATAAAALASLHNHRAEYDWDSDPVRSRIAAFLHGLGLTTAVNRTLHPTRIPRAIDPAHDSPRPP